MQLAATAATATVEEEGFWGIYSFTDYFTLSILDGHWQITNKTFANTGVASAQFIYSLERIKCLTLML